MKNTLMVLSVVLFAIGCDNTFVDISEGECQSDADCADGDPCTVDICGIDRTCVQIPSDNPACEPEPPVCVPTEEVCNGRDDDCDELADEELADLGPCGLPSIGECEDGHLLCTSGTVVCVDAIPATDEICDDLDNDCDGLTDEDCYGCDENADCDDHDSCTVDLCEVSGICRHVPSDDPACEPECDTETRYRDEDGDGYGDPEFSAIVCVDAPPVEGARVAGDCNDHDAAIHPSADEICDEVDNDCDGETDEGVTETRYFDYDNDGYGDPELPRIVCVGAPLTRLTGVRVAGDCNDRAASSHPGVSYDYCDEVDNDCDGDTDEAGGVHVEALEDLPIYDTRTPILGFRIVNDTCNVVQPQLRYLIEELHRVDDGSTVLDPCGIFDCSSYPGIYIHGYQSGWEFYLTTGGFAVDGGCLTGRNGGWVDSARYGDRDPLGNYVGSPPNGGYIDIVVTASIRSDAPAGQYQFMLKDYWMSGALFDSIRTFTCDGAARGDGTPVPSEAGVPILGPVFTVE